MKTLRTQSLNPEFLPLTEKNLGNFSIIVSDIDYTLIDFETGHQAGIEALSQIFDEQFAKEVSQMFNLILEGHRRLENENWEKRAQLNFLIKRIMELQSPFINQYGIKVWSRETWILLTAEKLRKPVDRKQIERGRDSYWKALSQNATLYSDAKPFLELLQRMKLPLILMTGSDSILKINDNLSLKYDPTFSKQYKRNRLKALPFSYQGLVIGDPIDKPNPRFFEKLFKTVTNTLGFSPPMDKILVIGDSQRNDLEIPSQLGCNTLLIRRN